MKVKNKVKAMIFALAASFLLCPLGAYAQEAPYTSLTVDKDGHRVSTVDGYIPSGLWDKFGEEELNKPSDLFLAPNGEIYIADTGNKRILVCDRNGSFLYEITEGLEGPAGVYVTEDGEVYVADPAAKKIFVFDADGKITKTFETPVSPLFGKTARYAPSKLVVNKSKTVYALSEGNSNGILTISDYGDFYGYFGANDTSISLGNRIKRIFFTEEQLKSMQKNVPASAANIDIDTTGLIYTVTQGTEEGGLKKYNMAGNSMLETNANSGLYADVAAGPIDNIFAVAKTGYIFEYTRDGELLFYFAGKDDGNSRIGLFVDAAAIDVDEANRIYVLDRDRGAVTVFAPTEYADKVHEALGLYQDGLYLDSREPWEQVLSQNSLFDFAYRGIGQAQYKLEDYESTMAAARQGGDYQTYSNAFWQIRNQWLRKNIVTVFWILAAFFVLRHIWKRYGDKIPGIRQIRALLRRLGSVRLLKELRFLRYVLKNPADAFYGIKKEGKVSVLAASLVYLIVFVIFVVNKYACGFLFKTVSDGQYDLGGDLVKVLGVMLLFVICNNMICSIRDGEANLKQSYCSFAYCFMPYIFLKPAAFVLSHVLTFNEAFLITMLNFIMIAGTAVLIVVMIREIQCYTYKETFVSILLTLFTMLVIVAAGIIIFALIKQVFDFIIGIFKEGYYRGR